MSRETHIVCDCCGRYCDDDHIRMRGLVKAERVEWVKWMGSYSFKRYHICEICWEAIREHVKPKDGDAS